MEPSPRSDPAIGQPEKAGTRPRSHSHLGTGVTAEDPVVSKGLLTTAGEPPPWGPGLLLLAGMAGSWGTTIAPHANPSRQDLALMRAVGMGPPGGGSNSSPALHRCTVV